MSYQLTMHSVVYRKPTAEHTGVFLREQGVQINVDFPDRVVGTVRVMIKHSGGNHV